ncbi:MAG: PilW family protein [Sumerlaeia bacterium]
MNYSSATTQSFRTKKAFTLMELLFAILIGVPMLASILVAFVYVLRIQATISDQSFVRINTDIAIQRLQQDIRNTSSGLYNSGAWQELNPLTGGAGNINEDTMVLQLLDSANGLRITWTYFRTPQTYTAGSESVTAVNVLSRRVLDLNDPTASPVTTNYINMPYSDLVFREVRLSEFSVASTTPPGAQLTLSDGSVVDDETTAPTPPSVVAIEIRGRTLHRLSPYNTIWNEIDLNGDGDMRNDAVGELLFGRTDEGDDPKWQYIYNVTTTLRNS